MEIRSKLFIRADADGKIGVGHIMRCIALAQAWRDQGGAVTLISHCESDALKERIQSEGCRFIALDKVCPDPFDMENTLSILKNENADQDNWFVLDGYHFTREYQKAIRDEGIRLLVIDDMNHLPRYHADILLNQNIHALDLNYHCDEDTTLLLGTRYVLLRREFLKYWDIKRRIPDGAKNILVTLGGADPDNLTLKVIEALKLLNEPDIVVRIIIGPANPHQETLRNAIASARFEAALLINPPNMPDLMAWADVAISAGGSTCWELAFMEMPSVLMALSSDQQGIVERLSQNAFTLKIDEHSAQAIAKALSALIVDHEKRETMSVQGHKLVDGYGSCRVVKAMEAVK